VLEQRVLARYLDGLHTAGWQSNVEIVHAGYLLHTVLRFELLLPAWSIIWLGDEQIEATQQRYNLTAQQIADTWASLLDFVIERRSKLDQRLLNIND